MAAAADVLTAAFRSAELHLWWGREHLVVVPLPAGRTRGAFPVGVRVVHAVTAWNPGGQRADPVANARADGRLRHELAAAGAEIVDAEGRSPDGSWAERSVAVADRSEAEVLALARRYGQAAVYRWTPDHRAVVWCDDRPDDVHGWELRR
jgi:hypothetical protein